ncbi:hypothetical protein FisN_13Hu348 [Fistulifera solaris]|uniref:Thioredoxin domain-containing protein n=1 Tax=Fistulifera solaris TaxID=1519565 RepID=A0A1Z5KMQ9_FISSO|nr:hypothetical protein FisN_13Hu348 [Fistulifera solaris]|eukprot:GAX27566.1 hypothetical protein FisN_13Hu348 [Fistulifera solaris]
MTAMFAVLRALLFLFFVNFHRIPTVHGFQFPNPPQPFLSASTRRDFVQSLLITATTFFTTQTAQAAPPIAIIAEELGYFPVTNREGQTVYVAQSVKRTSSAQAQQLALLLKEKGVVMAGTYWCPHTSRQKELFGKEAWSKIKYVECAPKGYQANPQYCLAKQVDGYPTWIFPNGKRISGERPLALLAEEIGFRGFRPELEQDLPPLGGASCQLSNQKQ